VDKNIPDYQTFTSLVNSVTTPILYSIETTRIGIQSVLSNMNKIDRLCIASENIEPFVEGFTFLQSEELFVNLINAHQITHIDFMVLDIGNDPLWNSFFNRLINRTGVIVGFPTDKIGYYRNGITYIPSTYSDSSNFNTIYFSDQLSEPNYKSLLGYSQLYSFNRSIIVVKEDGNLWGKGENPLFSLGIGNDNRRFTSNDWVNITMLNPSFLNKKVSYIYTTNTNSLILFTDNTLWFAGTFPGSSVNNQDSYISMYFTQITTNMGIINKMYGSSKCLFVLSADGSVWVWGKHMTTGGYDSGINFIKINQIERIRQVSCGVTIAVALTQSNQLYFITENLNFTTVTQNNDFTSRQIKMIVNGSSYTAALMTDGSIWFALYTNNLFYNVVPSTDINRPVSIYMNPTDSLYGMDTLYVIRTNDIYVAGIEYTNYFLNQTRFFYRKTNTNSIPLDLSLVTTGYAFGGDFILQNKNKLYGNAVRYKVQNLFQVLDVDVSQIPMVKTKPEVTLDRMDYSGEPGIVNTITGKNLIYIQSIKIGTTECVIQSQSYNTIQYVVPELKGNLPILLLDHYSEPIMLKNESSIFYYTADPRINKQIGMMNHSVTFTDTSNMNIGAIYFGSTNAEIVARTTNTVTVTVPPGTGTVNISFKDPNNTTIITLTPLVFHYITVDSLSQNNVYEGIQVTITGTNFLLEGLNNSTIGMVMIGNKAVNRTITNNQIVFTVPENTETTHGPFPLSIASTLNGVSTLLSLSNSATILKPFIYYAPYIQDINRYLRYNSTFSIYGSNIHLIDTVTIGGKPCTIISREGTIRCNVLVPLPTNVGPVEYSILDSYGNEALRANNLLTPEYDHVLCNRISNTYQTQGSSITLSGQNLYLTHTVHFGETLAPLISRNYQDVIVTVPPGSGDVVIKITDEYGNIINGPTFSYITINALSPLAGTINTPITLIGTNLLQIGNSLLNSSQLSVINKSNTSVIFRTPAGEGTATIFLKDLSNNTLSLSNSSTFTYQNTTITNMVPNFGQSGSIVTINGLNLSNTSTITCGNTSVNASFTKTNTSVLFTIPENLNNFSVSMTDFFGNTQSVGSVFSVPRLLNVTPFQGPTGTTVTLVGVDMLNVSSVLFGSYPATIIPSSSNTSLIVTTPQGSGLNAPVNLVLTDIRNNNIPTTISYYYENTATITGMSQNYGKINTVITFTGTNFLVIGGSNEIFIRFGEFIKGTNANGSNIVDCLAFGFGVTIHNNTTMSFTIKNGSSSATGDTLVPITIQNGNNYIPFSISNQFTLQLPVVTSISHRFAENIIIQDGTDLIIRGKNFDSLNDISIVGTPGNGQTATKTGFTFTSDTITVKNVRFNSNITFCPRIYLYMNWGQDLPDTRPQESVATVSFPVHPSASVTLKNNTTNIYVYASIPVEVVNLSTMNITLGGDDIIPDTIRNNSTYDSFANIDLIKRNNPAGEIVFLATDKTYGYTVFSRTLTVVRATILSITDEDWNGNPTVSTAHYLYDGMRITINAQYLDYAFKVKVGGIDCPYESWRSNYIRVRVPPPPVGTDYTTIEIIESTIPLSLRVNDFDDSDASTSFPVRYVREPVIYEAYRLTDSGLRINGVTGKNNGEFVIVGKYLEGTDLYQRNKNLTTKVNKISAINSIISDIPDYGDGRNINTIIVRPYSNNFNVATDVFTFTRYVNDAIDPYYDSYTPKGSASVTYNILYPTITEVNPTSAYSGSRVKFIGTNLTTIDTFNAYKSLSINEPFKDLFSDSTMYIQTDFLESYPITSGGIAVPYTFTLKTTRSAAPTIITLPNKDNSNGLSVTITGTGFTNINRIRIGLLQKDLYFELINNTTILIKMMLMNETGEYDVNLFNHDNYVTHTFKMTYLDPIFTTLTFTNSTNGQLVTINNSNTINQSYDYSSQYITAGFQDYQLVRINGAKIKSNSYFRVIFDTYDSSYNQVDRLMFFIDSKFFNRYSNRLGAWQYDVPISTLDPRSLLQGDILPITITDTYIEFNMPVLSGINLDPYQYMKVMLTNEMEVSSPTDPNADGRVRFFYFINYTNPSISTILPLTGPENELITIQGKNLSNNINILFNNELIVPSISQNAIQTPQPVEIMNLPGFIYTYTESTIQFRVPPGSGSVPIVITDGLYSKTYTYVYPYPSFTSITPTSGPNGQIVSLNGHYMTENAIIKINGSNISSEDYTSKSSSSIVFTMPNETTSSTVTITVLDTVLEIEYQQDFTFLYKQPTFTSITPNSGPNGKIVTLSGANMTPNATIQVNGTNLSLSNYLSKSSSSIIFTMPSSVELTATITIVDLQFDQDFLFNYQNPTIYTIEPLTGPDGQLVTITGNYFTSNATITFNGNILSTSLRTSSRIEFIVPAGFESAPLVINDNSLQEEYIFQYPPTTFEEIFPTSGQNGQLITLTGSYMSENTKIFINNIRVYPSSQTKTSLVFTMPTGNNVQLIRFEDTNNENTYINEIPFQYKNPDFFTITPSSGFPGQVVTIQGMYITNNATVKVNGVSLPTTIDPRGEYIRITMPTSDTMTLMFDVSDSSIQKTYLFTYLVPDPVFSSLTNRIFSIGKVNRIQGLNITPGVNVKINGTALSLLSKSSTSVAFSVPSNITQGDVVVSDGTIERTFTASYLTTPVTFFNDGYYHYINLYSDEIHTNDLQIYMNVVSVTGSVGFNFLTYTDALFTTLEETSSMIELVSGEYGFVLPASNKYAVARLSLLPGSSIILSSFQRNRVEQVQGTMTYSIPTVRFLSSRNNTISYRSLILGQISNPLFRIEMTVKLIKGRAIFNYFHFTDNTYTTVSTKSTDVVVKLNNNIFTIDRNSSFVVSRITLTRGTNLILSSFKINNVEQLSGDLNWVIPSARTAPANGYPIGTLVRTDSGDVPVENLVPGVHTLKGKSIASSTLSFDQTEVLVAIQPDTQLPISKYLVWL
jgi:hypothetical protein